MENNTSSCWRKDGSDYICDLPELPRAIVISYCRGFFGYYYYCISERSWFPFKKSEYAKEYTNPQEAICDSEKVILKFITSFLGATNNNVSESQKLVG